MSELELTPSQKELAHLFIATKVQGKVRRRQKLKDGSYRLYETQRETGVVDFSNNTKEFALASHLTNPSLPLSPYYFNFRNLSGDLLEKISTEMAAIIDPSKFDYCVGVPNSGSKIADVLGKLIKRPSLPILYKENVGIFSDRSKFPIGNFNRLLVVEDVFTTGASTVEAYNALDKLGWGVAGVVGVIDREQGGVETIEGLGVKVRSIFGFRQLLEEFKQAGLINRSQYQRSRVYLAMTQMSSVCRV